MIHKEWERVREGDDRRKKGKRVVQNKGVCVVLSFRCKLGTSLQALQAKLTGPLKYQEKVGTRGNMMNENNQLQSTTPSIGLTWIFTPCKINPF